MILSSPVPSSPSCLSPNGPIVTEKNGNCGPKQRGEIFSDCYKSVAPPQSVRPGVQGISHRMARSSKVLTVNP